MWILLLQILGVSMALAFIMPVSFGFWLWWTLYLEDLFGRHTLKTNTYVKCGLCAACGRLVTPPGPVAGCENVALLKDFPLV